MWIPAEGSGYPASTAGWSSRKSSSGTNQDWMETIQCGSPGTGRQQDVIWATGICMCSTNLQWSPKARVNPELDFCVLKHLIRWRRWIEHFTMLACVYDIIELDVLSRGTYSVFVISVQILLIVGKGTLVDSSLPCASQIDTGVLLDQCGSREERRII